MVSWSPVTKVAVEGRALANDPPYVAFLAAIGVFLSAVASNISMLSDLGVEKWIMWMTAGCLYIFGALGFSLRTSALKKMPAALMVLITPRQTFLREL